MTSSLIRSLSLVMSAFFSYAAVVQWNDPDWFTWMFLYAIAACFSLQYAMFTLPPYVSTSFGVVAILRLGLVYFLEVKSLHSMADLIETELGREMGGCVLVAFWMAVMASTSNQVPKEMNSTVSVTLALSVASIVIVSLGYPLWLQWNNVSLGGHCMGTLPTLADLFPISKTEL